MAQLHWYAKDIEAWQRDTAHLDLIQVGAYTRLLDHYYQTQAPLSANAMQLHRVCRAIADAEKDAVDSVAAEFFPIDPVDGLRHNKRADLELTKVFELGKKRRDAAGRRWTKQDAPKSDDFADADAYANADALAYPLAYTATATATVKETPIAPNEKISFDADKVVWRHLAPELVAAWREAYPAVDVGGELRKAAIWQKANPKNKKSNYERFLSSWLSRAQDKAPRVGGSAPTDGRRID